MAVCYTGDPAHREEVVAPIRALADPVVDLLGERPYAEIQSYLDDTEPEGMHYYWKTEYLLELGEGLLPTLRDLFAACPIAGVEIGLLHLAGALNERARDDGAVGNRDVRYVLGINGKWSPGDPNAETFRAWIRDAWGQVQPFSAGRTYINFQTADEEEERVRATYGENYDRLREVKARVDPGNLFRSNRNIRPTD